MCKNIFNVCLDDPNNKDSGVSCSYGNYESDIVGDDNIKFKMNVFDKKLSSLIFPFQRWTVRSKKKYFYRIRSQVQGNLIKLKAKQRFCKLKTQH